MPGAGRPFQPGVSGNPAGRPKGAAGLAALIRKRTRSGRELAEFHLRVMRGELEGFSAKERLAAADWLATRAFGQAPALEPVEEPARPALSPWGDRPFPLMPPE